MKALHLVVCIKQIPDPEGPNDAFQIDLESKRIIPIGLPPVINPFDENALEVALHIKDHQGAKVTAISLGEKLSQPVLKKALAAGADDLILLIDSHFKDLNSYSTAYVLSSAIRRIGTYDIILTGRQAGDWDFGATGLFLAEMLQIPGINLARKLEIKNDEVLVEKLSRDGYELVKALLPALITVSSEAGELRYTSIRALQSASGRSLKIFNAEDLELDIQKLGRREIIELSASQNERKCKFIEGASSQEKGENLFYKLREEGVI